jgi:N-acetylglucosaminyldiphosphoundecaprenol N-acetyl-beta-D-mannosaminyltransferase
VDPKSEIQLTDHRTILGIDFFVGSCREAVERMISFKGFLVVPSGPGLKDLGTHRQYREALLGADMAIMDSALMVMLWNYLEKDRVVRVSGLEYIDMLLEQPSMQTGTGVFWIMAGEKSSERNLEWLAAKGIHVQPEFIHIAPQYQGNVEDPKLVQILNELRPEHIIVTVGGGTQEPLGFYLKQRLDYRPGIHCIGAAIAFLSGDQVRIPMWADKLYLGWLCRCLSEPGKYFPRYWEARKLIPLMIRFRSSLPYSTQ